MATKSIIHVGPDDCYRITALERAGYFINSCASLDQFHAALTGIPPADAVAVFESFDELPAKAASVARATSTVPLILFQSAGPANAHYNQADFDLIVPALLEPRNWVVEVQAFLEESRALRAQSEALREKSLQLLQRSLKLRAECIAAKEKLWLERQRSKDLRERNRNR